LVLCDLKHMELIKTPIEGLLIIKPDVFEDDRGLYLFHNKDLALYEFLPALARAGVASFKIEGRMKSIHYIAGTLAFYRQVMDGRIFCGGRMRVLCAINSQPAIQKILACMGLPTRAPPIAPAISDEDEFCQYQ